MAVTHSTVATLADEAGKEINKAEWNADHVIDNGTITNAHLAGSIAASKLVGTDIATVGTITSGTWNGTDIAVADGGTGSSTAAGARTNLGLVIGTDVQAFDAALADISALAVTDGNFIVADGANWVAESGATARTSLGLGSIATQSAASVAITGGAISDVDLNLKDETIAADGDLAYNATTEELNYHNGQRALTDEVGWSPYAIQLGDALSTSHTTTLTLATSGGSIALPISVQGHMLLESLVIRQVSTASERTAEWRLYRQRLNNGNAGENTVDEVANANGTFTFTPTVASNETSTPSTTPIYLAPGVYWLVIRNTSGAQTLQLGRAAGNPPTQNAAQTKTLGSALGATLDMVAATWTKTTDLCGVLLRGRAFGETTAF